MFSKGKLLALKISVILLIVSAIFAAYSFNHSHNNLAGQMVYKGCNGDYVSVETIKSIKYGSNPCRLSQPPFVFKNDYTVFYVALALFGAALLANLMLWTRFIKDRPKKK
jgi:hypothetical protein